MGIVDVRLPPTHTDDGLRAALRARARVPGLPVLILSQYVEQLYARELLADQMCPPPWMRVTWTGATTRWLRSGPGEG